MRSIEATGKSVDEAIFNGLKELEISIDEVEIQIIKQETKGVFGIGAKPARVLLTEKEPEKVVVPDFTQQKRESTDARPQRRDSFRRDEQRPRQDSFERRNDAAAKSADAPAKAETDTQSEQRPVAKGDRPAPERRENREPRQERRPRQEQRSDRPQRQNAPRPRQDMQERYEKPDRPEISYTAEAAEGNVAAEFLKGLLSRMGIEAKVLANIDGDNIRLRIDSETMGILIGHRGETLDAMQYLTSLTINKNRKEDGYVRVSIDTEGYRDKREETLTRLARKVASQVKATGKPRSLEPMNPYERRVLHSTLQNNPFVTTYSEGEEPNRRVIIAPKERRAPRQFDRPKGPKPQKMANIEEYAKANEEKESVDNE